MINYIIVDDEYIAHDIIKGYCDLLSNLKLIKHCYDAIEALACLKENEVDLIFLDLNMPKLKGFDFLSSLQRPPNVIVTTAYKEHALDGYELNVIDYLLKPFSFERFIKAINKIEPKKVGTPVLNIQKSNENNGTIFLRSNKKHVQVKLNDILFVEAVGNYCKVVTTNDEIKVREKISEFVKLLGNDSFFQVHKSFVVAKQHIEIVEGNRIGILDFKIPIGKFYKGNVDEMLGGE